MPKQAGNNHPTSIPTGVFKTKDGYFNIAVAGGTIWERFCNTIGHPEWITSAIALVLSLGLVQIAQADPQPRADQLAFRAIYKELVETDTTHSAGDCTLASQRARSGRRCGRSRL